MSDFAVEIRNLTKDFSTDFWKPKVRALENVSFSVRNGGIFGLIGPNGAGKTTTIKTLLGLVKPTSGSALISGRPISDGAFKKELGYLPENAYYYDFLSAGEVIDFYARLFGMRRAERKRKTGELLDLVGLARHKDLKLRFFSKGMLQRVGIAQCLVNDPKLVILDEPMSGLDPIGRKDVRDVILRLTGLGKTVLFSSHILPDVEAICDEVALLVKGKLMAAGSLADLVKTRLKSVEVTFEGAGTVALPDGFKDRVSVREVGRQAILSASSMAMLPEILSWGSGQKLTLISVVPEMESLEDLFMEKVGTAK
jgi:ABC-2 type transport system ATP-binding protein